MTAAVPGALNVAADDLSGDMILPLATSGPGAAQTTLDDLAQFLQAAELGNIASTSITTVGAGTLTAAALKGGLIVRSGPIAAFTDTTTTAALLLAALGADAVVGTAWLVYIKNLTAFSQTLAAGVGVTLTGNKDVIPANSAGVYLLTYATNAPAFTMQGVFVVSLANALPEVATALVTVGAGTITAAGIVGRVTSRGGAQSATDFTDTTGTADAIIAAIPNARIGVSFEWLYHNDTDAPATLTGGVGVTVSGTTIVPKNSWARFLVSYTAASTVTIVGIGGGQNVVLPPAKITTGTAATFAAGDITGAYFVDYLNNASNVTLTTRTATQMFADIPNCQIGHAYKLAIRNLNATGTTLTAADGSVTLSGTMTIAQNVTRTFEVVFTSATAVTITSMGISAAGA
jgi:hypothetical protein